MYVLYTVILLTTITCHVSAKTPIQNNNLTYECTKDDKIIITGPSNGLYGSIYAVGNESHPMCKVDKFENASVVIFTVRDCNVSLPVKITVMNDRQNTTDDMVLGGRNVTMHELKCSNVRRGGLNITKDINIKENDTLKIISTYQKDVNMTMKILVNGSENLGPNPTVVIGQEMQLIIEGNAGFAFLARTCIATDGTTSQAHRRNLIVNGTTLDASVISPFSNHTDRNHTEVRTTLYAFHFLHTNKVSIICTITVCQDDDNSCPFQIHDHIGTRRKRSALIKPHTDTLETSFRVIGSNTMPVDSNKSGTSSGRMSVIASLILFVAFGFARILP